MPLNKLFLRPFEPPTPLHILPELRADMLAEIKNRYTVQIEPTTWKAFSDDSDDQQEFLAATIDIVESVIQESISKGKLAKLSESHREYLHESLWKESQAFWYEHIDELQLVFSFIEKLLASTEAEIQALFPDSERVFGPSARALLLDLAFQYEFWRYARVAKPDLVDLRRMINISGQVVESIFFAKVFFQELSLGKVILRLKGFRDQANPDRRGFFARFRKGNLLLSKEFLTSLNNLKQLRDAYSHGGSSKQVTDDSFRESLTALLDDKVGLLPKLYEVLRLPE